MAVVVGSLVAVLGVDSNRFSTGLKGASVAASSFTGVVGKKLSGVGVAAGAAGAKLGALGGAATATGTKFAGLAVAAKKARSRINGIEGASAAASKGLKAIAVAAAVFAGASIKKFAEVDRALVRVGAIANATGDELTQLKDAAKEMGATTVATTTQATEALQFLAMAGLGAKKSIAALPAVLQLSQAAAVDLATAADVATNVMAGYGVEAAGMADVNDALVATFTNATVSLTEMGQTLKVVGPVAKGLHVGFNDLAAAIGTLGNAGLRSTDAGNGLKRALVRLVSSSGRSKKALGVLGISTEDASKGFVNLVKKLEVAKSRMGDLEFMGKLFEAFGNIAGPKLQALVGQGSDAMAKLKDKIDDAAGSAKRMQERDLKTLGAQFDLLKSAVEALMISLGDGLAPAAKAAAKAFIWLAQKAQMVSDALNFTLADKVDGMRAASEQANQFADEMVHLRKRLDDAKASLLAFQNVTAQAAALPLSNKDRESRLASAIENVKKYAAEVEKLQKTIKNFSKVSKEAISGAAAVDGKPKTKPSAIVPSTDAVAAQLKKIEAMKKALANKRIALEYKLFKTRQAYLIKQAKDLAAKKLKIESKLQADLLATEKKRIADVAKATAKAGQAEARKNAALANGPKVNLPSLQALPSSEAVGAGGGRAKNAAIQAAGAVGLGGAAAAVAGGPVAVAMFAVQELGKRISELSSIIASAMPNLATAFDAVRSFATGDPFGQARAVASLLTKTESAKNLEKGLGKIGEIIIRVADSFFNLDAAGRLLFRSFKGFALAALKAAFYFDKLTGRDTGDLGVAMAQLNTLTWEKVKADSAAIDATKSTTEAMRSMREEVLNMAGGFRGVIARSEDGGSSTTTSGPRSQIESLGVTAASPFSGFAFPN